MSSILNYRGYQGSVTYEDGVLVIRVLHVDDNLTDECDSAAEVQATFKNLIDDYIATCEELGRAPKKPFRGSFNVRVSPELHREAAMSAAVTHPSLNAWIAEAIEDKLAKKRNLKQFASAGTYILSLNQSFMESTWHNDPLIPVEADVKKDELAAALIAFEALSPFSQRN
jgi:predicted HicB family RNase H-like nuclease